MLKAKKWRNKKYLAWVMTQQCVITGMDAEAPHHIIGHDQGGTSTKASDLFTIPITSYFHVGDKGIHTASFGVKTWEYGYGSQWVFVARTINDAIDAGIITREFALDEIKSQVHNMNDLEYLLSEIG